MTDVDRVLEFDRLLGRLEHIMESREHAYRVVYLVVGQILAVDLIAVGAAAAVLVWERLVRE